MGLKKIILVGYMACGKAAVGRKLHEQLNYDYYDLDNYIEINQELMLCTDLNAVTNTVTVTRGARGTTAAAHTAGDLIKISPPFPRKNVFDAVCDQIKNLYPTLFAVETKQVSAKVGYIPLSGTNDNYLIAPIKAISQYTDFSAGTDDTGIMVKTSFSF